jgi:hypothetical protein
VTATAGGELRPTAGARFVLELVEVRDDGAAADYATAIYTPETEHHGTAVLRDDGEVAAAALVPEPAAELAAKLAIMARLVARGAAGRRHIGEKVWPARVMRWRAK